MTVFIGLFRVRSRLDGSRGPGAQVALATVALWGSSITLPRRSLRARSPLPSSRWPRPAISADSTRARRSASTSCLSACFAASLTSSMASHTSSRWSPAAAERRGELMSGRRRRGIATTRYPTKPAHSQTGTRLTWRSSRPTLRQRSAGCSTTPRPSRAASGRRSRRSSPCRRCVRRQRRSRSRPSRTPRSGWP